MPDRAPLHIDQGFSYSLDHHALTEPRGSRSWPLHHRAAAPHCQGEFANEFNAVTSGPEPQLIKLHVKV